MLSSAFYDSYQFTCETKIYDCQRTLTSSIADMVSCRGSQTSATLYKASPKCGRTVEGSVEAAVRASVSLIVEAAISRWVSEGPMMLSCGSS